MYTAQTRVRAPCPTQGIAAVPNCVATMPICAPFEGPCRGPISARHVFVPIIVTSVMRVHGSSAARGGADAGHVVVSPVVAAGLWRSRPRVSSAGDAARFGRWKPVCHKAVVRQGQLQPGYGDPESRARPGQTVRSASVGESRAARSAGSNPARAPMASAAPESPAPGHRGDGDGPALDHGVDRGGQGADRHPDGAAQDGQQHRLGEELGADVAPVAPSARRSPISDRRSSTEITMMFATPTAPTSSATAPSPRKRAVERALRRRAGPPAPPKAG